jgi:hypothetical protein
MVELPPDFPHRKNPGRSGGLRIETRRSRSGFFSRTSRLRVVFKAFKLVCRTGSVDIASASIPSMAA